MAIKPDAQKIEILEQIIEDEVSGVTLQFQKRPDGECAIYMYGDFRFGNRTFVFDATGELAGTGTHTAQCPRPTFIREVQPPEAPDGDK